MSYLAEIKSIIEDVGLPVETAFFSSSAPASYAVITPMVDGYDVFADNLPQIETFEARVSVFTKGNYITFKNSLSRAFLAAGWTIEARGFVDFDGETGYSHYHIDISNFENLEE